MYERRDSPSNLSLSSNLLQPPHQLLIQPVYQTPVMQISINRKTRVVGLNMVSRIAVIGFDASEIWQRVECEHE